MGGGPGSVEAPTPAPDGGEGPAPAPEDTSGLSRRVRLCVRVIIGERESGYSGPGPTGSSLLGLAVAYSAHSSQSLYFCRDERENRGPAQPGGESRT